MVLAYHAGSVLIRGRGRFRSRRQNHRDPDSLLGLMVERQSRVRFSKGAQVFTCFAIAGNVSLYLCSFFFSRAKLFRPLAFYLHIFVFSRSLFSIRFSKITFTLHGRFAYWKFITLIIEIYHLELDVGMLLCYLSFCVCLKWKSVFWNLIFFTRFAGSILEIYWRFDHF